MTDLLADVGGTRVRFALTEPDGAPGRIAVLECRAHAGLAEAMAAYLEGAGGGARPRRGAVAVAAPITGDRVAMTNHPWSFSVEDLRRRFALDSLTVVNDLSAVAHGLPHLGARDLLQVGGGQPAPAAAKAVLGPGTGLGVSGLVPAAGGAWAVLETEGGHVTMAAGDEREAAVLADLRRVFGHVSAERVLSGPGLVNLYGALCRLDGAAPEPRITPHRIAMRALFERSVRCRETLELAAAMLGAFAADLALTLGARGGVYIAGGIVPRYAETFAASEFRRRFEAKGRFSDYLAAIPTYVVLHDHPAFAGLAALVRRAAAPDGGGGDA